MIQTQRQISELVCILAEAKWIGIDTEADSLHAYPEKLCLLQISFPGNDVLVDPLAGMNLRPLLNLLATRELILHGADYDLRLLHRGFQFVPRAIFDTMSAARLLGYKSFGLSDIVQQHLQVALEKGPQKMNWALRPLPARMAIYALNDTRYLQPLAELLRSRLSNAGRLAWQQEVCARLIKECSRTSRVDPDELWRIRGSDRLDRPAMALLRELWAWREEEAVAANKPPYFILSHEQLVGLAAAVTRGRPTTDLVPRHLSAARADRLRNAIERGQEVPPAKWPHPRQNTGVRLTRPQQLRFDQLRKLRDARGLELEIDPALIVSKADLVVLAKGEGKRAELMNWQRKLLGLEPLSGL